MAEDLIDDRPRAESDTSGLRLPSSESRERDARLSTNVRLLAVASFFQDLGSESPNILLPLFLLNVVGAGTAAIGLVEGVAESTATFTKLASGWLSDRLDRRKPLVVLGYALSTATRPWLAAIASWPPALFIRFGDRVAKGIRTSPRDALLADSAPPTATGRAFGLNRAMDSLGSFASLVFAFSLILVIQGNALKMEPATFRWLAGLSAVPGILAVLTVALFVREVRARHRRSEQALSTIDPGALGRLRADTDRRFYLYLGAIALFTLGNSSDAFLVLRMQRQGLTLLAIAGVMIPFNLLYATASYGAGVLSDRLGRRVLLIAGWLIFAIVYLAYALGPGPALTAGLFVVYALYYATTEGVGRALVADMVSSRSRATAYGVYYGVLGVATLPASVLAGLLWQWISPSAPFLVGAVLAVLASLVLAVAPLRHRRPG
jgi:MFS family permease